MGYYTRYELTTEPDLEDLPRKVTTALCKIGHGELGRLIEDNGDSTKWYSYAADMTAASEMFSDITFTLSGSGE